MSDLKKLIAHLKSCNDNCTDVLKIRSSQLDENILNEFGISYEQESESKTIDLSNQSFKIYKNKIDALSQRESYLETDNIVIIYEEIIYNNENRKIPFFENIFYTEKLKKLFLDKEVIAYDDELSEVFILLSEKMGKVEIGYSKKELSFLDTDNSLKEQFNNLSEKLEQNEYDSFLRDNFIKISKDIKDEDESFYLTLKELDTIVKNANREFELYKHKFSFENFLSDLHDEKEKYIKGLQENLSDFLSKINSLPIQFGVYILLVFRFKDEILPLCATIILIIAWSAFSIHSLNIMKKSAKFSKRKFEYIFKELSLKSGIKEEDLEKDKNEIMSKIEDINKMINRYRGVVIIFTLVFIFFSSFNIYKEVNKKEKSEPPVTKFNIFPKEKSYIEKKFKKLENKVEKKFEKLENKVEKLKEKENIVLSSDLKITTASLLNVREESSINSNILHKLTRGTIIKVIKKRDVWFYIKTQNRNNPNIKGWVSSKYLSSL